MKTYYVAERLWSPKEVNDPKEALPRLLQQRCRFVTRGIPASPLAWTPGPGCY
jgi:hexosaminidase